MQTINCMNANSKDAHEMAHVHMKAVGTSQIWKMIGIYGKQSHIPHTCNYCQGAGSLAGNNEN